MTALFELDTDSDFDTTGGELTVPSDRAPRPALPPQTAASEDDDATIVVDRGARSAQHAPPGAAIEDDTVRSPTRRQVAEQAPDPDAGRPPSGRVAYAPDPVLLREPYASRPVAPVIAERAAHPVRMAQPQADGEAVDRSVRGRARRRVVGLGLSIAGAAVLVAGLLVAVLASLAH